MKYRTVKIGEVIPRNALWSPRSDGTYEPYFSPDDPYDEIYPEYNNIFDLWELVVPIEESEVTE